MIIKDFLRQIASRSPNTDPQSLLDLTNNAAQELWDSEDFPGSLDEESFKPYDTTSSFVSFPHYVDAIRGVRPCDFEVTEVYSKAAGFQSDFYLRSPWMWREIERSPLRRNLEEASQLTIRRTYQQSQQDAIIFLAGKTDVAENENELIEFSAGETEKQTEKAYETLSLLGKDRITDSNFQLFDSAGNEVSLIPNNYLEVSHLIVQILERCTCSCACGCSCVRVLFKRKLPPFFSDLDIIPSGIELPLMLKVQEWIDLKSSDRDILERSQMVAEKANSLWNRLAYNKDKSNIKPLNFPRTPFVKYSNNDL